ncbi:MAG TPA: acetoacetate decarboxylase family protein [Oligoflexus sp.]|uniref:acetoacetate decarboxylase family protein n=1 Tax=Oligoflexus sp. TaxID=1971216 RepID=UPI002D2F0DFE|nr:acetoacetate decarboxylase family protein [Oligoflexus sp.]HYX33855.1 acetoacetate decarboxylase family protein [Oligoflexus sp.]
MDNPTPQVVEAPWQLKGNGYMFLYNFPKNWASKAHFMPIEQSGEFQGGLGTLMLVDYETSNVGPYRELLLIPGKFCWLKFRNYAISRIWVSSQTSVVSGRANWGIPKQLADFHITAKAGRRQSWEVQTPEGQMFFKADLSHSRLPLPIHTALVPFPLLQTWEGRRYLTKFKGYGLGHLAKLENLQINGDIFPDITPKKPLIGLRVDPFHIRFPVPQMIEAPNETWDRGFIGAIQARQ